MPKSIDNNFSKYFEAYFQTGVALLSRAVFLPKRLLESFTIDMAAVRRSLLCNTNIRTNKDVILLYGYYGTVYELLNLAKYLSDKGYKVHLPHYDSLKPTPLAAEDVRKYIIDNSLKEYFFIGHSKGGIIAKYLIKKYEDIYNHTIKIITLATPHNGSIIAFLPFPNGSELRVNSNFVKDLAEERVEKKITAISNKQDMVIIPRSSQKVKYGKNIEVDVWGHANISSDKKTLAVILEELKQSS